MGIINYGAMKRTAENQDKWREIVIADFQIEDIRLEVHWLCIRLIIVLQQLADCRLLSFKSFFVDYCV